MLDGLLGPLLLLLGGVMRLVDVFLGEGVTGIGVSCEGLLGGVTGRALVVPLGDIGGSAVASVWFDLECE